MNQLRPLVISDIPQLVALRRRIFKHSAQESDSGLARYYQLLFFDNPWRDVNCPSLVQEGPGGEILGFIGAIPRPMLLGEERITAVTSTELMVAPEARGLIGHKLLRRLFAGPQHLTYSDRSTDQVRVLYEGLGGHAVPWYSFYWTASLDGKPLRFDTPMGGGGPGIASRLAWRAARMLSPRQQPPITRGPLPTRGEPLALETVVTLTRKLGGKTLVPDYNAATLEWLMKRVSETHRNTQISTIQVVMDGKPIGWFICVIGESGDVQVVQLAGLPGREGIVFDHLVAHASNEGGAVLRGRLDRRFASVIAARRLPLTVGRPWTVVRAERPDLASQFLTGAAFFSRLDAEWWIGT